MERLILWDIDGTLLRAGVIAREAFAHAVARVVGRDAGDHAVAMSGKTDPQIALEILQTMAVVDDDAHAHLPAILSELESQLADAAHLLRERGRVLPGVRELLERLDAEPGVVQSVLTGNTAANAAAKLSAFGLDAWFDLRVAAYGSDDADRTALVPVALRRVEECYGSRPERTWVIGDTANDLACARAGGARCLLVSTGRIPHEELEGLHADAVLRDLSDVGVVLDLLRR